MSGFLDFCEPCDAMDSDVFALKGKPFRSCVAKKLRTRKSRMRLMKAYLVCDAKEVIIYDPSCRPQTGEIYRHGFGVGSNRISSMFNKNLLKMG